MQKNYFISVNYNSCESALLWLKSIRKLDPRGEVIIVDNYYSEDERRRMQAISDEHKIVLLTAENIGYGRALNAAFEYLKVKQIPVEDIVIFAGNLDVKFTSIAMKKQHFPSAYVPTVNERNRNRNPFLTTFQRRLLGLHRLSLLSGNRYVFMSVILLLKLARLVPSKIWAVHGSMFIFDGEVLNNGRMFNEETFLYSEELEFASYLQYNSIPLVDCDVAYEHVGGVATSAIVSSISDFMQIWKPSFINWLNRWR